MPLPVLPLDVLSNIISLLPEPYYPPSSSTVDPQAGSSRSPSRDPPLPHTCISSDAVAGCPSSSSSSKEPKPSSRLPANHRLAAFLDPYIPLPPSYAHISSIPDGPASADISSVSRASHSLLEAARPWLWENVEVRSGRGWLAVVNALTEEVVDQDPPEARDSLDAQDSRDRGLHSHLTENGHREGNGDRDGMSESLSPAAVSPEQAFARPMMGSGIGRYISLPPPGSQYPNPYASGVGFPVHSRSAHDGDDASGNEPSWTLLTRRDLSPAQPAHPSALLTPPESRSASPRFAEPALPAIITDLKASAFNNSPGPMSAPSTKTLMAGPLSAASAAQARLRGRSRSPRRSLEIGQGISAVLERARSLSTHRQSSPSGGTGGANRSPEHDTSVSPALPRTVMQETSTRRSPSMSAHVRSPLVRGPSMHRTRTFGDGWEDDEEEDNLGPLALHLSRTYSAQRSAAYSPSLDSPSIREDFEFFRDKPKDESGMNDVAEDLLPMPGPYIRHLSFVLFRTVGSRRTQDEAVRGRFVTAGRLEGVIKNAPNLVSLAMTEYVDSALSFPVVEELFFRGHRRPRAPRRLSTSMSRSRARARSESVDPWNNPIPHPEHSNQADPPRPIYVPYEEETEDEMWARRGMFTALEALDLTGCVSRAFTEGMEEFWETWLAPDGEVLQPEEDPDERDEPQERGRGRGRARHRTGVDSSSEDEQPSDRIRDRDQDRARKRRRTIRTPLFHSLKRLSLRACTSLEPPVIQSFILSFPSLTHLDLSGTRVPTSLLIALTDRPPRGVRLKSLSLARCARLDPTAVVTFLTSCPVTYDLEELSLYVPLTQTNYISTTDVDRFLTAPCIKSGRMRYLDLSGMALPATALAAFPAQPALVSLGLSNMPHLSLAGIAEFLIAQAPGVEILTLAGMACLNPQSTSMQVTLELHARLINPCTAVPFSLAGLSLSALTGRDLRPGPTRLRVIELSGDVRRAVGEGGNGEWKVVKSKGGRGWYVDTSAGWVNRTNLPPGARLDEPPGMEDEQDIFVRHLPTTDPRRKYLTGLSDANGRVGSNVGWHSRKMEVVRGWGMLGREGGLAGVGAFAFEE